MANPDEKLVFLLEPNQKFDETWDGYKHSPIERSRPSKSVVRRPGLGLTDLKPLPKSLMTELKEEADELADEAEDGDLTQEQLVTLAEEYDLLTAKWIMTTEIEYDVTADSPKREYDGLDRGDWFKPILDAWRRLARALLAEKLPKDILAVEFSTDKFVRGCGLTVPSEVKVGVVISDFRDVKGHEAFVALMKKFGDFGSFTLVPTVYSFLGILDVYTPEEGGKSSSGKRENRSYFS